MRHLAIALIVIALLAADVLLNTGMLSHAYRSDHDGWSFTSGLALFYAAFALWPSRNES